MAWHGMILATIVQNQNQILHCTVRTTLDRSRGASSCVYVKVSWSRSHFFDPAASDAAIDGRRQHDAIDTAIRSLR